MVAFSSKYKKLACRKTNAVREVTNVSSNCRCMYSSHVSRSDVMLVHVQHCMHVRVQEEMWEVAEELAAADSARFGG